MDAADPRCAMLSEMSQSAYRLGVAFAAEAERADEIDRKIEYAKLFDRCFFAVRVGIALDLRLRREGRWAAARARRRDRDDLADRAELDPSEDERRERPEHERPEHERPVRYTDGDREREVERATLPLLIGALQGVAADAQALPAPRPAELPTLRDLLARYSPGHGGPSGPPAGQALRARLAGSAANLPGRAAVGLLTRPPNRPPTGAPGPPRSSPRAKPD